jgi:hypothetical protein
MMDFIKKYLELVAVLLFFIIVPCVLLFLALLPLILCSAFDTSLWVLLYIFIIPLFLVIFE